MNVTKTGMLQMGSVRRRRTKAPQAWDSPFFLANGGENGMNVDWSTIATPIYNQTLRITIYGKIKNGTTDVETAFTQTADVRVAIFDGEVALSSPIMMYGSINAGTAQIAIVWYDNSYNTLHDFPVVPLMAAGVSDNLITTSCLVRAEVVPSVSPVYTEQNITKNATGVFWDDGASSYPMNMENFIVSAAGIDPEYLYDEQERNVHVEMIGILTDGIYSKSFHLNAVTPWYASMCLEWGVGYRIQAYANRIVRLYAMNPEDQALEFLIGEIDTSDRSPLFDDDVDLTFNFSLITHRIQYSF